eukprot:s813_g2.t4
MSIAAEHLWTRSFAAAQWPNSRSAVAYPLTMTPGAAGILMGFGLVWNGLIPGITWQLLRLRCRADPACEQPSFSSRCRAPRRIELKTIMDATKRRRYNCPASQEAAQLPGKRASWVEKDQVVEKIDSEGGRHKLRTITPRLPHPGRDFADGLRLCTSPQPKPSRSLRPTTSHTQVLLHPVHCRSLGTLRGFLLGGPHSVDAMPAAWDPGVSRPTHLSHQRKRTPAPTGRHSLRAVRAVGGLPETSLRVPGDFIFKQNPRLSRAFSTQRCLLSGPIRSALLAGPSVRRADLERCLRSPRKAPSAARTRGSVAAVCGAKVCHATLPGKRKPHPVIPEQHLRLHLQSMTQWQWSLACFFQKLACA